MITMRKGRAGAGVGSATGVPCAWLALVKVKVCRGRDAQLKPGSRSLPRSYVRPSVLIGAAL